MWTEFFISWLYHVKTMLFSSSHAFKERDKSWVRMDREHNIAFPNDSCYAEKCYNCERCCGIYAQIIKNFEGASPNNEDSILVDCETPKTFKWYIKRFRWKNIKHKRIEYNVI